MLRTIERYKDRVIERAILPSDALEAGRAGGRVRAVRGDPAGAVDPVRPDVIFGKGDGDTLIGDSAVTRRRRGAR